MRLHNLILFFHRPFLIIWIAKSIYQLLLCWLSLFFLRWIKLWIVWPFLRRVYPRLLLRFRSILLGIMIVFFNSHLRVSRRDIIIALLLAPCSLLRPSSYFKIFIVLPFSKIIKLLHLFILFYLFVHFSSHLHFPSLSFFVLLLLPGHLCVLHLPLVLSILLCLSRSHEFSFSKVFLIFSLHLLLFLFLIN